MEKLRVPPFCFILIIFSYFPHEIAILEDNPNLNPMIPPDVHHIRGDSPNNYAPILCHLYLSLTHPGLSLFGTRKPLFHVARSITQRRLSTCVRGTWASPVSSVPWLTNPGLNEGFYGKIRGKSAINGIFHGKITGHPRKKKCRFIAGNIIYNGGFSRKPWS